MPRLSESPVRVSPADPTDDAEVSALRDILRSDIPYPDEPPTLEDSPPTFDDWCDFARAKAAMDASTWLGIEFGPTDEDSLWWAMQGGYDLTDPFADRNPVDDWEDLELDDLDPEPDQTPSGSYDLPNGFFGHAREEP